MSDAEAHFQAIIRDLSLFQQPPSVKTLTLLVSSTRGKLIRFDQHPLHGAMTGLCIALADCDLIRTCSDADALLTEWTMIHELCHLYLNHLPQVSLDLDYPTFQRLPPQILSTLSHSWVCMHTSFLEPREELIETLATQLADYFEENARKKSITKIYGMGY